MYSFNIFAVLSLLAAFFYLILSVYVYAKNPKAKPNRLFVFAAATIFVWGLGEGMMRASIEKETAYTWAMFIGFGSSLHSPALLHFWLVFSGKVKSLSKKLFAIIYLPMATMIILRLFFSDLMIRDIKPEYWGYTVEGTELYGVYTILIVIYTIVVVAMALKKASQSQGVIKKQARNIGIAIIFPLALGISTQVIKPFFPINIPEFTVIGTIIYSAIAAYTINKYGFLTITEKVVSQNVIDTMMDYMITVDKQMNIVLINNSVTNDLGHKKEKIKGMPLNKILISKDNKNLDFEYLSKNNPIINYKAILCSVDDKKIKVSANISALKEGGSDIFGFVFILRDISKIDELINNLENKKNELEKSNDELKKFNDIAVDREIKMIELKKTIKELKSKK